MLIAFSPDEILSDSISCEYLHFLKNRTFIAMKFFNFSFTKAYYFFTHIYMR